MTSRPDHRQGPTPRELAAALAERADLLAADLLPGGRREGAEWRCGSLAGEPGKSLSIRITGGKRGLWADFATGEKGDALDLVAAVLFGGARGPAMAWARDWLRLPDRPMPPPSPAPRRDARTDGDRVIRFALALWREAKPIAGTLAERYLRARGLTLPLPPTLRYHGSLRYREGHDDPRPARILPGMVAAVQAADRRVVGVHRTFLDPLAPRKAAVPSPKKMLGALAGGAVRLGPAGPELIVGEGLETCLAVMQATGGVAWAALSTSGIRGLVLPEEVRSVVIAADGDPPGVAAAEDAARRWTGEGRAARIALPPNGLDFNDVLTGADDDGMTKGQA